jgi:FKBP12-rapamycin complex-associated protein
VRKYLEELLTLVYEHWHRVELLPHLLALLEQLSRALHDEFRLYMPDILPLCVGALAEAERKGDYESVGHVLHALEVFSSSVEEHLHLVLPALVRLFQPGVADVPLAVRQMTLQSLRRLLPRLQLTGCVSSPGCVRFCTKRTPAGRFEGGGRSRRRCSRVRL